MVILNIRPENPFALSRACPEPVEGRAAPQAKAVLSPSKGERRCSRFDTLSTNGR
jgi:hypothetical protein